MTPQDLRDQMTKHNYDKPKLAAALNKKYGEIINPVTVKKVDHWMYGHNKIPPYVETFFRKKS